MTTENTTEHRKVVINPVTRVEGHGKVTLHLDPAGHITEARFHIIEFRGFERFIQGRRTGRLPRSSSGSVASVP